MIHESAPWKAHLVRDARLIERWAAKPKHSERRSFLIERKVFLAAYAMRKLDDGIKLSDLLTADMQVLRFPPAQGGFTLRNNHSFDECFDLENPVLSRSSRCPPLRCRLGKAVYDLVATLSSVTTNPLDPHQRSRVEGRPEGGPQVDILDGAGLRPHALGLPARTPPRTTVADVGAVRADSALMI
ncbi:hypothetical protein ASE63_17700 [Bosea sp. Root381]|nr:hypothetical protein ASE63_17700 [Bosea sp. Root381]